MPVSAPSSAVRSLDIRCHDPASGRWVRITEGAGRLRVEVGSTGNRLDPDRRVRLSGHDLHVGGPRAGLRAWWPVQEISTHRIGQFFADLWGELRSAASPDPDDDLARVDEAVARAIGGDDGMGAVAATLRLAYPLLDRPLAEGARPEVVPVAVEPLLRHDDLRSAVRATLAPRPTRPAIRALGRALLPGPAGIAWEPVVCALMAAQRCGPEQITAILSTPVHHPGAVAFSVLDVDRARAMFSTMHPRRVAETLVTALEEPGGTARLQVRIATWDARPPPPPVVRPAPAPAPAPAAPVRRRDVGSEPIAYPTTWQAVEGLEVAAHRAVLPRTGNELLEWGARMENCLGAYRNAAAAGRTRIIGFTLDGDLRLAAEVSNSRLLRQLEGRRNTKPGLALAGQIVRFLRTNRLVEADARRPA